MHVCTLSAADMALSQEEASRTKTKVENNALLTGWKIILGLVEVKDALKNAGHDDDDTSVAAFLNKVNLPELSAKGIAQRMHLGQR